MSRLGLLVVLVGCWMAPAANAQAPPDRTGPPLDVTPDQLAQALGCSPGLDGATRTPVLLVQGTGATAKDNWSWTYEPALTKLGIPWCHVDLVDQATSDIQRSGELIVAAIRTMHARAGRRISIIGHSQGGMVPRWALRFWPDARALVDDVIGFAPSNHGSTRAACSAEDPCSAAGWQQRDESEFMKVLNAPAETWAGISYTNVATRLDETVVPLESAFLTTGDGQIRNVFTQDVCPTDPWEHLTVGTVSPAAYALAVDALAHDGPADPARIALTSCLGPFHPGVDLVTGPLAAVDAIRSFQSYSARTLPAEPVLACYTTAAGCLAPRPCVSRRRVTVALPVLRGVRATLDGRRIAVSKRGRRSVVRVDLRGRGAGTAVLRVTGRRATGRRFVLERRLRTCTRKTG